jgi:hypothetical protein
VLENGVACPVALAVAAQAALHLKLHHRCVFLEVDPATVAPPASGLRMLASRAGEAQGHMTAETKARRIGILVEAFRACHRGFPVSLDASIGGSDLGAQFTGR